MRLQAQVAARQRRGDLVGVDVEPLVRRAAAGGRLVRHEAGNDIRFAPAPNSLTAAAQTVSNAGAQRQQGR